MRVIVAKNYDELSDLAARQIGELVNEKPAAVLGLATGSTPEGMYKRLVELYNEGIVDFSKTLSFNLDEYKGLKGEHPQSYRYFMNTNLFNYINIDKSNTYVPDGTAENIEEECLSYDERITAAGGIDLQVLGIGNNGHIGFNEPSDFLYMGTHLTDLTEDTINANSRFFDSKDEVPTQAITMGLGGIMKAKRIMLLASGEKKAPIISKLVDGKISTKIPASILQVHPDVIVIVDEAAASLLKKNSIELISSISL
jgi:glucosamine-6-phosphate deaminase